MKRPPPPPLWVIALAAVIVFVNALAVVYSAADNRAGYSRLTELRKTHDQLVVRRGQLTLEALTLASHARIAHLAETRLDMRPPRKVRVVRVP